MSELAQRILRRIHEFYQIGNFFSNDALGVLLGNENDQIHEALTYLAECGYIRQHEGQSWEVLAYDRQYSCAVCGKYAPKRCPGCKHPFCDEHYTAHVEDNVEHLKGLNA